MPRAFVALRGLTAGRPQEHRTGPQASRSPISRTAGVAPARSRVDVADLIDTIKQRSPAVARAAYAALRRLFGCAWSGNCSVSPCQNLTAPPRPEAKDRVLTDEELRTIWNASDGLGFPFGPVVKLLMLTGQRRGEVAGMTWAEVDLDARAWRTPKERTKNREAHEVDLNPQATRQDASGLGRVGLLGGNHITAGRTAQRADDMTERALDVWWDGRIVGLLTQNRSGDLAFTYSAVWLGDAFKDCFALLRRIARRPAVDVLKLLDAAIFNLVVGNWRARWA